MVVDVELRADDYVAFWKHVRRSLLRPNRPQYIAGLIGLWLLTVLLTLVALQSSLFSRIHWPSAMGAATLVMAVFCALSLRVQRKFLPVTGGILLGAHHYEINADGIQQRSPHCESRYSWLAVHSIDDTPAYIIVMLDRVAGLIIPKRSFAVPTEASRLKELLQSHAETARAALNAGVPNPAIQPTGSAGG